MRLRGWPLCSKLIDLRSGGLCRRRSKTGQFRRVVAVQFSSVVDTHPAPNRGTPRGFDWVSSVLRESAAR